jgi:hypothetical protein
MAGRQHGENWLAKGGDCVYPVPPVTIAPRAYPMRTTVVDETGDASAYEVWLEGGEHPLTVIVVRDDQEPQDGYPSRIVPTGAGFHLDRDQLPPQISSWPPRLIMRPVRYAAGGRIPAPEEKPLNGDRDAALRRQYPLTIHGETHREFIARWHGVLMHFAGVAHDSPVPSYPDRVDFSGALLALKAGHPVTRYAWGDKNVHVVLQLGYPDGIGCNANTADATGLEQNSAVAFLPYLMVRVNDKPVSVGLREMAIPAFAPWTPDTIDVLAEDWQILPRPADAAAERERDVTAFGAQTRETGL